MPESGTALLDAPPAASTGVTPESPKSGEPAVATVLPPEIAAAIKGTGRSSREDSPTEEKEEKDDSTSAVQEEDVVDGSEDPEVSKNLEDMKKVQAEKVQDAALGLFDKKLASLTDLTPEQQVEAMTNDPALKAIRFANKYSGLTTEELAEEQEKRSITFPNQVGDQTARMQGNPVDFSIKNKEGNDAIVRLSEIKGIDPKNPELVVVDYYIDPRNPQEGVEETRIDRTTLQNALLVSEGETLKEEFGKLSPDAGAVVDAHLRAIDPNAELPEYSQELGEQADSVIASLEASKMPLTPEQRDVILQKSHDEIARQREYVKEKMEKGLDDEGKKQAEQLMAQLELAGAAKGEYGGILVHDALQNAQKFAAKHNENEDSARDILDQLKPVADQSRASLIDELKSSGIDTSKVDELSKLVNQPDGFAQLLQHADVLDGMPDITKKVFGEDMNENDIQGLMDNVVETHLTEEQKEKFKLLKKAGKLAGKGLLWALIIALGASALVAVGSVMAAGKGGQ